jgi:peptidoglycan/LPS O-acetylase OafA/YrhL
MNQSTSNQKYNVKAQHEISGLTSLRFLAAIAVVVCHIELIKKILNFSSNWNDFSKIYPDVPLKYISAGKINWASPLISSLGYYSVVFFFVLSGFLISHNLTQQKIKTGKISTLDFYIRRIVRIWPLYFFVLVSIIIILQFNHQIITIPQENRSLVSNELIFLFYFLVSPNVLLIISSTISSLGHLWSIGVEEHFYAFWPLVFEKIHGNKLLLLALCYFIFKIIIKFIVIPYDPNFNFLLSYVIVNKFECMIFGAWLSYKYNYEYKNLFKSKYINIIILLNILLIFFFSYLVPEFWSNLNYLFVASLSGLIIVKFSNFSVGNIFNNKIFHLLGHSSYAIYLVHFPITIIYFNLLKSNFNLNQNKIYLTFMENFTSYLLIISISISIGIALHLLIEVPIKKLYLKNSKT